MLLGPGSPPRCQVHGALVRSFCGPITLGCGPFAVSETPEQPRTGAKAARAKSSVYGDFRPYSLTFAEPEGIGETGFEPATARPPA
jgi:hypothetical protein